MSISLLYYQYYYIFVLLNSHFPSKYIPSKLQSAQSMGSVCRWNQGRRRRSRNLKLCFFVVVDVERFPPVKSSRVKWRGGGRTDKLNTYSTSPSCHTRLNRTRKKRLGEEQKFVISDDVLLVVVLYSFHVRFIKRLLLAFGNRTRSLRLCSAE